MDRTLTSNSTEARIYPTRPYLAVSAAIFRDGRVLIVRRAQPPAHGLHTLPGGVVELGETLVEAVMREVREETGLDIEPHGLAGYRQVITRDGSGRIERHFVILPFAARWLAGEITLNEELAEGRWLEPDALSGLKTTEGLADIVAAAGELIAALR
jgi:ADP-ribose pyrophosphatase YjhB (NUDIX family)